MTREEVANWVKDNYSTLQDEHDKILNFLKTTDLLPEGREKIIEKFEHLNNSCDCTSLEVELSLYPYFNDVDKERFKEEFSALNIYDYWYMLSKFLRNDIDLSAYEDFIDSDLLECDGDIIITDPCYVIKKEDRDLDLEDLGVVNYISKFTLYGDWSCHVFDTETNEVLGQFCADSAMVAVFYLDEVLTYRPDFEEYIEKYPHAVARITNFKGQAQIVITNEYEDGKAYSVVHVVGHGVDKVTGKSINFISKQTGL